MIPLLSVVVPVYNAERYLKRCLDSILSQDIRDQLEIITINDASTDSSLMILREYEKRYPQIIKIIDLKTNQGVGVCRYIASKISQGNYIGFVDSDDYLRSNNYFSRMVDFLEKERAEVAITGFSISTCQLGIEEKLEKRVSLKGLNNNFTIFNGNEEINKVINDIDVIVWNKVYKRNFYVDSFFVSLIPCFTGEDLVLKLNLFFANKIVYVPSFDYIHDQREGSLMDYTNKREYTYNFFKKEFIDWSNFLFYQNSLIDQAIKPKGLDSYINKIVCARIFGNGATLIAFSSSSRYDQIRIAKLVFSYMNANKIRTKDLFGLVLDQRKLGIKDFFLIFLAQTSGLFKYIFPVQTLKFFYFINSQLRDGFSFKVIKEKIKKYL